MGRGHTFAHRSKGHSLGRGFRLLAASHGLLPPGLLHSRPPSSLASFLPGLLPPWPPSSRPPSSLASFLPDLLPPGLLPPRPRSFLRQQGPPAGALPLPAGCPPLGPGCVPWELVPGRRELGARPAASQGQVSACSAPRALWSSPASAPPH
uniref:Uncharacterized protein n=1 Tax=Myotis myotis TaxID=51298 RepID=A0A7J7R1C1_MYOMY|nr:hypothetical protein mMyoMyo1_011211 [Myotis myotis]